jgi:DNA-binding MarR family transcriptional regulator
MTDIDSAALKLQTAIRLLIRRAYSVNVPAGPTRSEQGVLGWLESKGKMTPGELAAMEKVRPQTMGQTLDSLDRRQWIKRTPHPKDRRQVLITLSAAGREGLLKRRALRHAWLVDKLKKLTPEDCQTLIEGIEILDRIAQS